MTWGLWAPGRFVGKGIRSPEMMLQSVFFSQTLQEYHQLLPGYERSILEIPLCIAADETIFFGPLPGILAPLSGRLIFEFFQPTLHQLVKLLRGHLLILLVLRRICYKQWHTRREFTCQNHGAGPRFACVPLNMRTVGERAPIAAPAETHLLGQIGSGTEEGWVTVLLALDVLAEVPGEPRRGTRPLVTMLPGRVRPRA